MTNQVLEHSQAGHAGGAVGAGAGVQAAAESRERKPSAENYSGHSAEHGTRRTTKKKGAGSLRPPFLVPGRKKTADYARNFRRRVSMPTRIPPSSMTDMPPSGTLLTS
jgi:hypothetical protein